MTALVSQSRIFATRELMLGMIVFQRTNSLPATVVAMTADVLLMFTRRIVSTLTASQGEIQ